jgi:ubiquitin carboxyl-terminal hydrolase L3
MVESNSDPNWLPLESNPEIINDYVEEIGFETSKFLYYDMLGVEEWAQDMIPKPVLAVMFLYPIKEETEELDEAEKQRILKDGQKVSSKVLTSII